MLEFGKMTQTQDKQMLNTDDGWMDILFIDAQP